jgi:hypothetical protein
MTLVAILIFAWLVPAVVAHFVGQRKHRPGAVFYGLILGWLGVLILAVQKPLSPA